MASSSMACAKSNRVLAVKGGHHEQQPSQDRGEEHSPYAPDGDKISSCLVRVMLVPFLPMRLAPGGSHGPLQAGMPFKAHRKTIDGLPRHDRLSLSSHIKMRLHEPFAGLSETGTVSRSGKRRQDTPGARLNWPRAGDVLRSESCHYIFLRTGDAVSKRRGGLRARGRVDARTARG